MFNEKQTEILIAIGNILEAKEDIVRNAIHACKNDDYVNQYIKMRDEAYDNLQINLVRLADATDIPRDAMPGIYPKFFDYHEEKIPDVIATPPPGHDHLVQIIFPRPYKEDLT